MLVGDPSSGYSYKCTVTALATIIETDIADGFVTIGTTQTVSGAKTFSNNLTLTSVANTPTDPDKFLSLNASNVVTYRTGAEVLSDIGGQGSITLTTTGTSGAATLVGSTLNIPNYGSALSGYVPYTGATTTVDLNTRLISSGYSQIVGDNTSSGGYLGFKQFSGASSGATGYTSFFVQGTTTLGISFSQSAGVVRTAFLSSSLISNNTAYYYNFPNKGGTFALLDDVTGAISGTTNYIPKFTSSSAIGNSQIFDNGTNVGINNTSPSFGYGTGLQITSALASNLRINTTGYTGLDIIGGANGDGYIYLRDNNPLIFGTNNTERLRISSTGNVSIGNTNNTYKLDVSGDVRVGGSGNPALTISGSDGAYTGLFYINAAGGGSSKIYANGGSNTLILGTNSTDRATLDASGNLGIGTSAPSYKLDVSNVGGSVATQRLYGNDQANVRLRLENTGGRTWELVGGLPGANNSNFSIYDVTGTATRLTIDASGNLGLGVSPSAWDAANTKALQLDGGSFYMYGGDRVFLGQNIFFGSGGDTYVKSAPATTYRQYNGQHAWFNAVSGTAGNAISFTQAMTLASTGNLAVGGTSDGGYRVTITSTSGAQLELRNSANNKSWRPNVDGSDFAITETGVGVPFIIKAGGNVGIGTTSPAELLQVGGSSGAVTTPTAIRLDDTYRTGGDAFDKLKFYLYKSATETYGLGLGDLSDIQYWAGTTSTGVHRFFTSQTERMRITSGGEVYIAGTTDQGAYNLQVNGTGVWGAGAYVNGSDSALKQNIQPLDNSLDLVKQMKPVTYTYKESYSKDSSVQTGFIAQDLQILLKDKNYLNGIVKDGTYLSVAYQNLIPLLVKAIQEQQIEIEKLKNK